MARILLDRVTKRFGTVEAVKELSLDIRDGEFFCILGPPGAGKTTTLRLIVGLERPDEGGVFIDGESMRGVHPGRRDIAIVFQNLALYPDKTVFENIAFPLRERRVPEAEIQQRVRRVADLLGIAGRRSSAAASASASPSAAPSCGNLGRTSWTSPSPTSTPCCGSRCGSS
jgi:ABC-type sugar transport system ATPase subunit